MRKSAASIAIPLLVLLLPFEPMEPLVRIEGFQLSFLELAAFVLLLVAAVDLTTSPTGRVPLAHASLALLLAFVLSAGFAEGSAILPLKFTLRMTAAVVAFLLTSASLSMRPRFDVLFASFAIAGGLTAVVGLLEAARVGWTEPLVGPFREHAFEVGGRLRIASTFSYPNTAGGFLALSLPPAMSFLARKGVSATARFTSFVISAAMFGAILLTFSRGALLGAIAASLLLWSGLRASNDARAGRLLWLSATFALIGLSLLVVEPSLRWRASSEGDRSWYRAAIVPLDEELELEPDELARTEVSVRNLGKLPWSSTGPRPIHLSYRWFRVAANGAAEPVRIEGERTPLCSPVAPGEEAVLAATVRAPRRAGGYLLVWDMVQEHTTWFSDKVGLGVPVSVVVGDAPPVPGTGPRAFRRVVEERSFRPGRRELWTIALRLFAQHPLLGVGPDNFRWLYGPASGHARWDRRVFANSLYLELLATVGLVGFLCFVVLVGRALAGLHEKRGTVESAVLTASLAGFLVHGLVDYLLAFTPIYLAFFVLLGASSAWIGREPIP